MASSGNSQGMLSAIGNLASLLPPPPEPAATKDSTSSVAPAKSEPTEAEKEVRVFFSVCLFKMIREYVCSSV